MAAVRISVPPRLSLLLSSGVVQILRRGGKHLEPKREYRPWAALVLLVAAGSLFLAASSRPAAPLTLRDPIAALVPVLLLVGVTLYARPRRLVAALPVFRRGDSGEHLDTLLERLPNDYYLINDVVLRAGRIDHVVAGPCGIVVILTRRARGHVQCEGDQWWVNGRRRKSYGRRAKLAAMAVRKFLAARHPELRREIVRPIVVFTDPRCELHVHEPQVAVIRGAELLAHVVELGLTRKMDRTLAHLAARGLAGGGPARFSAGRPAPRNGTGH